MANGKRYNLRDYAFGKLPIGLVFSRAGIRYECVEVGIAGVDRAGEKTTLAKWLSECKDCGEGYFIEELDTVFPVYVRCPKCGPRRGT